MSTTTRQVGDTITVRATLLENKAEKDKTTVTFQVAQYGWYAELSPAVVLVKPSKLDGAYDGFRFAPTLSWINHYMPRPDDTSWYDYVLRGFQPGIGIHSAFTNFASNQSVQIGLGLTISLWTNRLQFGVGQNLMADSAHEGKYYYFIGSDLIGLLQSMGLAK